ncbi:MAG TPA: TonB-dependent receptor [Bryobacteraceae bacterium]|nr:TonB-dependent receptor [Bryobacteraceae bacterium]
MHYKLQRLCAALCTGLLFASLGLAQSTFGSITGVVTDPSGSIVPNAEVSVTNAGTGGVRKVNTGSTGVFNVPNLDVGAYVLRVSAQGFTTYERAGLNLESNQVLNVNVELAVGSVASVVEVQAASPTITTETNDLSGSVGSAAVEQLPLVSRHTGDGGVYAFTLMNTGIAAVPSSSLGVIQGARLESGSVPTMDGIAVMAYPFGASPVQPSLESVQEITVVKATGPAEFATAGNIKVVTKAGTNEFHGGAFWDFNDDHLNARNFFSSTVPFRVYHDFGTSLGGPIKKNKLFFFGAYEGSRENAKVLNIEDVPLPAFRTGDFSALKGTVKNPFTGQPFTNNQIPASLISPVSQKVQDFFYPLPNTGPVGALSNNWQAQYKGTTGFTHYDHFDARADYNISSSDMVFGRVSWRRMPLDYTDVYPLHETQLRRTKSGVVSWTHTITPAAVNEFRFGATFHVNPYFIDAVGSDLIKQFGIQGISTTGVHNAPIFNITGVSAVDLDAASDSYQNNPETDYEWIDNLSWTRGRHLMKFGIDVIRDQLNGNKISANVYGSYSFSGIYSGQGYADFLLGLPQQSTLGVVNPPRDFRGTTWAIYAQDQFKVSRSLTLNYGIRWELAEPYTSKHGAIFNFDPRTGSLVVPDAGLSRVNPFYPKNIPIVTASQVNFPSNSLLDFRKNNIQPRVGFAYKLFGGDKTVIRGGYGIYGNLIYSALDVQQMSGGPFSGSVTYFNAINNGAALFSFPTPFLTSGTTSVQNVAGVNPHLRNPYTQQWNLTVEQQVGSVGLRVSYLGSRSVDLLYRRNLNQPPASTMPFSNALRPYGLYNQVIFADTGGTEFYNALEVAAQKKFSRNLTFNTGWTWSKDLTDTQDAGGGGTAFGGQVIQDQFNRVVEKSNSAINVPQRFFGYALYTLPVASGQRFLSGAKGPVQQILGGWDTAWVLVAQSGQWFTPSFSGFDPSNTNNPGGRPDRIANGNLSSGQSISHWFDTSAFAIPGCPNSKPVCTSADRANVGRFGNSALDILSGPRIFNGDFALMKYFNLRERMRLQFRMTMANALNHPNFAVPRSNISAASTVGTINGQVRALLGEPAPRQIDFALRLEF